jgi:hypothetical protein
MFALAVTCPSEFQTSDYRRSPLSLAQSAQAQLRDSRISELTSETVHTDCHYDARWQTRVPP